MHIFCELELNCFVNNALSPEIPPQSIFPSGAGRGGGLDEDWVARMM